MDTTAKRQKRTGRIASVLVPKSVTAADATAQHRDTPAKTKGSRNRTDQAWQAGFVELVVTIRLSNDDTDTAKSREPVTATGLVSLADTDKLVASPPDLELLRVISETEREDNNMWGYALLRHLFYRHDGGDDSDPADPMLTPLDTMGSIGENEGVGPVSLRVYVYFTHAVADLQADGDLKKIMKALQGQVKRTSLNRATQTGPPSGGNIWSSGYLLGQNGEAAAGQGDDVFDISEKDLGMSSDITLHASQRKAIGFIRNGEKKGGLALRFCEWFYPHYTHLPACGSGAIACACMSMLTSVISLCTTGETWNEGQDNEFYYCPTAAEVSYAMHGEAKGRSLRTCLTLALVHSINRAACLAPSSNDCIAFCIAFPPHRWPGVQSMRSGEDDGSHLSGAG